MAKKIKSNCSQHGTNWNSKCPDCFIAAKKYIKSARSMSCNDKVYMQAVLLIDPYACEIHGRNYSRFCIVCLKKKAAEINDEH